MANPSPPTQEPVPLNSTLIAQALAASIDAGQTLDFSHFNINAINDEAAQELATIGKAEDDDEGSVTRCARLKLVSEGGLIACLLLSAG